DQDVARVAHAVQVFRDLCDRAIGVEQDLLFFVLERTRLRRDIAGEMAEQFHDIRDLRVRALDLLAVLVDIPGTVPRAVGTKYDGFGHWHPPLLSRCSEAIYCFRRIPGPQPGCEDHTPCTRCPDLTLRTGFRRQPDRHPPSPTTGEDIDLDRSSCHGLISLPCRRRDGGQGGAGRYAVSRMRGRQQ